MQFTGKRLRMLRGIVARAISDVGNDIGLHPAPNDYPDDIEDWEEERQEYQKLLAKIDEAILKD